MLRIFPNILWLLLWYAHNFSSFTFLFFCSVFSCLCIIFFVSLLKPWWKFICYINVCFLCCGVVFINIAQHFCVVAVTFVLYGLKQKMRGTTTTTTYKYFIFYGYCKFLFLWFPLLEIQIIHKCMMLMKFPFTCSGIVFFLCSSSLVPSCWQKGTFVLWMYLM